MNNAFQTEIETSDDAAVEQLLTHARAMTDRIDQILSRPLNGLSETLRITADADVLSFLREAQALAASKG